MANLRDIKRRIRSVTSTRQITHTMEMVSTTKIMKALERAAEALPYKQSLMTMLANLAGAGNLSGSPLLERHEHMRRAVLIAVASDRGLAGGFNVQVQRGVLKRMRELEGQGIHCEVIACGKKPIEFFHGAGVEPALAFEGSAEPTYEEAMEIALYCMRAYETGDADEIELWYHHAKSRVEQTLVVETILPISTEALTLPNAPRHHKATHEVHAVEHPVFEFEPSAHQVLARLLPTYVQTTIYYALIDSAAAEHAARRRAMQSATENADEIIETLSRTYNRLRQSSITTELNEIVGGANALEDMS